MLVQPVGEPFSRLDWRWFISASPSGLSRTSTLTKSGSYFSMCAPKSSPYSKSNSSTPDFSAGMDSFRPSSCARRGCPSRTARRRARPWRAESTPRCDGLLHALEDQPLGVRDLLGLLGRRVALDAEHLLLERPAVVERQDVELAVVAERHRLLLVHRLHNCTPPGAMPPRTLPRHRRARRIGGTWQAGRISSSSARAAARRSRRTSRSARTAARACASARRSWSGAACRRRPSARRARRGSSRCGAARSRASGRTGGPTSRSRWSSCPMRRLARRARAAVGRVADLLLLGGPLDGDWWRVVTTQFVYGSTSYEVATLSAVALFGWLLERRHGWWAPLLVFLDRRDRRDGGSSPPPTTGSRWAATPAALALLAAWAMRDVLGRRRGREDDADLLGTLAIAVLLVLLPLATDDANALAGLGGRRGRHRARASASPACASADARRAPRLLRRRDRRGGRGAVGARAARGGAARSSRAPRRSSSASSTRRSHAADWFGSAHQAAVLEAAGKPDVDERLRAVRHADRRGDAASACSSASRSGYELAHELMRRRRTDPMDIRFLGHVGLRADRRRHPVLVDPFITGNPKAAVERRRARADAHPAHARPRRPLRRHGRHRQAHRRARCSPSSSSPARSPRRASRRLRPEPRRHGDVRLGLGQARAGLAHLDDAERHASARRPGC